MEGNGLVWASACFRLSRLIGFIRPLPVRFMQGESYLQTGNLKLHPGKGLAVLLRNFAELRRLLFLF